MTSLKLDIYFLKYLDELLFFLNIVSMPYFVVKNIGNQSKESTVVINKTLLIENEDLLLFVGEFRIGSCYLWKFFALLTSLIVLSPSLNMAIYLSAYTNRYWFKLWYISRVMNVNRAGLSIRPVETWANREKQTVAGHNS